LAAACFTARVLRRVGCRLPIQLWHGADEQTGPLRRTLKHLDVACVNADEIAEKRPFRFLHGHRWKQFQLKPYAIAHSPFREVLLLDAGCSSTRNPEFLFDWHAYREQGAAFWPDALPSRPYIPADVWEAFGIQPSGPRLEARQLLIDKKATWTPLQLTLWYNAHADLVYNLVWRDKDTFKIAWLRLGRSFAMPQWPAIRERDWLSQHGPAGEVLFRHRCRDNHRGSCHDSHAK
jgi:alpha 1,2-mannosyltransferase